MSKFSPEQQEQIEELVANFQEGDTEAFSEIYEMFVQRLYRYIYYRVPEGECEDILETVFLKVWENRKKYKRQKSNYFSAWIFRIAHNLVADFYRMRKEPSIELDPNTPDEDREHNPLRFTQNQLSSEHLQKALGKLSESHQQIIVLKFINDLSNKEISEIVDKSEGALRILQFRALKALKEILTEMGIDS